MMSAAIPAPLPIGSPTAAGIGVVAPIPLPGDPPVAGGLEIPVAQGALWGTIALAEAWEAGPVFLLDFGGGRRRLASGMFVRRWIVDEPDALSVGIRVDVGWAWLGASVDLVGPLSDELWLSASPGLFGTPELAAARLPLGLMLRVGQLDVAVEGGAIVGTDGRRARAVPYMGAKVQIGF